MAIEEKERPEQGPGSASPPGSEPVLELESADVDPIDELSDEDADKLRRGEIAPPEPKAKREETVPHEQFHRANERLKEERARAEKAEQASTLAMQRLAELLEASKQQQQPQEQQEQPDYGPDPEENPIAWAKWRQQRDIYEDQARQNWVAQQQRTQYEQEVKNRLINAYAQDAINYKEQTPDWGDAYQHFINVRHDDLETLGYTSQTIDQMIEQDELSIAYQALSNGKSPAELLYKLAQSRGYKGSGQGQRETLPRDEGGKFVAAAEAMDRREATKKAAKSLNGAGSTADDMGELTPEKIVNMTEAEFKAFKTKYGEDAMRVAFGQRIPS